MRLINADSLKDYIDCGHLRPPTELCFSELDVCNMIDKRPTIDAVEVVRCKDCKYGEERIEDYRCWMLDEDWDIRFSPMHFCSYGRRREGGEV